MRMETEERNESLKSLQAKNEITPSLKPFSGFLCIQIKIQIPRKNAYTWLILQRANCLHLFLLSVFLDIL